MDVSLTLVISGWVAIFEELCGREAWMALIRLRSGFLAIVRFEGKGTCLLMLEMVWCCDCFGLWGLGFWLLHILLIGWGSFLS